RRASAAVGGALGLFGLQLLLNLAWSGIFFAERQPGLAFAEIVLLWFAILATAWAFRRISGVAAALLVPYLAWVAFASALNFAIWRLNV
ncbi:TspO/MBR family protein, partial [Singulisphaera rosea]